MIRLKFELACKSSIVVKVCNLILCDSLLPGVRYVDYVSVRQYKLPKLGYTTVTLVIFHMLILNCIVSNGYFDYSFNMFT